MARHSLFSGNHKKVAFGPPSVEGKRKTLRGSLLLEAIIGIGIFSLFLAGIGLSLVLGERSTIAGGDRTRAAFIAEEQLEAVRQMRNQDFASVTTGEHGVALAAGGWTWSGTSIDVDGYRATVVVTEEGTDWLGVMSTVRWNFGETRSGSVVLRTFVTDWRKIAEIGDWRTITEVGSLASGVTPMYRKIAITGTHAFVTGSVTAGGKGLSVFDISNPSTPVAVATSFDLGVSADGVAAYGDRLYLATDDPSAEVQVYDIADPENLSSANLVNSYDLPGSAGAVSITIYGDTVFVGSTDDGTRDQLYALEMSETGPMVEQGSLSMSGSVFALALQDGYAYAATGNNVGELLVVDIFDPESLVYAPGNGIDMTNTQDAVSVALSGTSALIGRKSGSTIDELTLYDVGYSPVPSPPPGPWTLEIGGNVNDLAAIPGSRFAFSGGDKSGSQILVLDLVRFAQGGSPTVDTADVGVAVNGLAYDWQSDRLFAVSDDTLFIFAPGP